jgi:hypothetical protein
MFSTGSSTSKCPLPGKTISSEYISQTLHTTLKSLSDSNGYWKWRGGEWKREEVRGGEGGSQEDTVMDGQRNAPCPSPTSAGIT